MLLGKINSNLSAGKTGKLLSKQNDSYTFQTDSQCGYVFLSDLNNDGDGISDAISATLISTSGTLTLLDNTTGGRGTFASWRVKVYHYKNVKAGDTMQLSRGYGEYVCIVGN